MQPEPPLHVVCGMTELSIRAAACLLAAAAALPIGQTARASGFTAFAEDEDACRRIGAQAIGAAAGPEAAHRYDAAYGRCMQAHIRQRQMGAYAGFPLAPRGNPHGFEYPDAFYSIPYATPGYGYDGFSY